MSSDRSSQLQEVCWSVRESMSSDKISQTKELCCSLWETMSSDKSYYWLESRWALVKAPKSFCSSKTSCILYCWSTNAFMQMRRNVSLPTFGQLANKYWEVITVPSGKKDALVWMLYLIAMTRRTPLNMANKSSIIWEERISTPVIPIPSQVKQNQPENFWSGT